VIPIPAPAPSAPSTPTTPPPNQTDIPENETGGMEEVPDTNDEPESDETAEMPVNEIIFRVRNRRTVQAQLTIKVIEEEVPEVVRNNMEQNMQRKIYKYLEMNKTNIEDEEIENITIKFQVEKEWLESSNMSENDVVLWRYNGTEWIALETIVIDENSVFFFYEATSPGFSFFAIGEKEEVIEVQIDDQNPFYMQLIIFVLLPVIMVSFAFGIYYRRKNNIYRL
jgi:PGF-pre-PGF domain-containing protein